MLNYAALPNPRMAGGLELYFMQGIEPGSFLTAVLENNLREACGRADDTNRHLLFEHVSWLYNEAPGMSLGSPEKVRRWIESGGIVGQIKAQAVAA